VSHVWVNPHIIDGLASILMGVRIHEPSQWRKPTGLLKAALLIIDKKNERAERD
jgi:hypothetical protein